MQVNFNTGSKGYAPSFGMAKLTTKGEELARQFVENVPKYSDSTALTKKNALNKMLKQKDLTPERIADFFTLGTTDYAFNNTLFYKKQIATMRGQKGIRKFLAGSLSKENPNSLSGLGEALKDQLVAFFDKNISNQDLSAKEGKKVLRLVEPYMPTDQLGKRMAVLSDKIFSE